MQNSKVELAPIEHATTTQLGVISCKRCHDLRLNENLKICCAHYANEEFGVPL